jgi:signal transduction histidine kinase
MQAVSEDAAARADISPETGEGQECISQGELAQAQREFVANVSHELKTPLAVISGQVELLQSMGDEIDRDYYFSSIREEITKMSDMVGNLLKLTSMEHHMEEMELAHVNLSDMMEYMILKYAALFQQNAIRLHTEIEKDCIILGNQMYLEQAVNNYIMNAFQHTAQGQTIRICLKKEGNQAVICVYNEGQQIKEEDMEHIWQDFYKRSEGKKYGGNLKLENAGLGLFLVKKIVDNHHGSCGVENREHGVEFWIRVPLVEKE